LPPLPCGREAAIEEWDAVHVHPEGSGKSLELGHFRPRLLGKDSKVQ
jgi:hypothetical protein